MIHGIDLFGREPVSPNERKILKAANKTALDLYKCRFSPALRDNWDKDVLELTLGDVEKDVVYSIAKGYPNGVSNYVKTII